MSDDQILQLLIKANKMGAQGMKVVGYVPCSSGSEGPLGKILYTPANDTSASKLPWYLEN